MPTVVTERSLFEEVGGFDEQQLFGEFHDLCLRLALKGEVVVVREPLCSVRVHGEHYSSDRTANHAGWFRLYQKMAATTTIQDCGAYCVRMQADESLNLARAQADKANIAPHGLHWAVRCPFPGAIPHWWWGAFRE